MTQWIVQNQWDAIETCTHTHTHTHTPTHARTHSHTCKDNLFENVNDVGSLQPRWIVYCTTLCRSVCQSVCVCPSVQRSVFLPV
jgi:hypothetical protein